jgi:FtsH-binding integral membrane protein
MRPDAVNWRRPMSEFTTPYPTLPREALGLGSRAQFILRTYNHLFGAVALFTLLEILLFKSGLAVTIAQGLLSVNWLFVLGGFMIVSWLATRFANQSASLGVQYLALGAYVVAQAILFVPLLFVANYYAPGAIQSAAGCTLVGFGALTAIAFISRKDFSFLRAILMWVGVLAVGAIVAGVLLGFQLGTWFSVLMVGVAGAAILYDTSNVIHHFPEDRYVGAALQLFASVALMFWYLLRILSSRR